MSENSESELSPDNRVWQQDKCSGVFRNERGYLSVVHQHDDGYWWWYDETWATEFGSFMTKAEADISWVRYCETELL